MPDQVDIIDTPVETGVKDPPTPITQADMATVRGQRDTARTEVDDLKTRLATSEEVAARHQTALRTAEGKVLITETTATQLAEAVEKIGVAEAKVTSLETELSSAQTGLVESRKAELFASYGIEADALKDKTLAELDAMNTTLSLVPSASKPGDGGDRRDFVGGGGDRGGPPAKAMDKITAGLAAGDHNQQR